MFFLIIFHAFSVTFLITTGSFPTTTKITISNVVGMLGEVDIHTYDLSLIPDESVTFQYIFPVGTTAVVYLTEELYYSSQESILL